MLSSDRTKSWIRKAPTALLLHSHGLLALGAAAQHWWIGELGLTTDPGGVVMAALLTIAGYGYLRLVRASETDIIPSEHIHWVQRFRWVVIVAVLLSSAVAAWLALGRTLVFGPWSLLALLPVGVYLLPMLDKNGKAIGLREIPGAKAFVVALGWTFVTVGFGNTDSDPEPNKVIWMMVMQFCFFLAMAIAFDIGDLKYDRPGLRTIPQLLGKRWAKAIALVLLVPWLWYYFIFVLVSYSPIFPDPNWSGVDLMFLLPLLGIVLTALVIAFTDPDRPKWYFAILLDGMVLMIPMLGWLGGLL